MKCPKCGREARAIPNSYVEDGRNIVRNDKWHCDNCGDAFYGERHPRMSE